MKKIICIIASILILCALPINIFALNTWYADYYGDVYVSGDNRVYYQIEVFLYDDGYGLFSAHVFSNFMTNLRVDEQIVVEYIDGTYDYGSRQGNYAYDTYNGCFNYFNYDSSKTINAIYTETHVYIFGSYYDTMTHDFYWSDFSHR